MIAKTHYFSTLNFGYFFYIQFFFYYYYLMKFSIKIEETCMTAFINFINVQFHSMSNSNLMRCCQIHLKGRCKNNEFFIRNYCRSNNLKVHENNESFPNLSKFENQALQVQFVMPF